MKIRRWRRRRKGRKAQLLRRRIWIGIAVVAAMSFFLFFSDYSLWTRIEFEMQKRELEEKIRDEERRRDSLRHLIERLRKDTLYIEKLAREEYGMVRDGEEVYLFKEE